LSSDAESYWEQLKATTISHVVHEGAIMCDRKTAIDPEGKYDFGELRRFEEFALRLLDLLPGAEVERTRDVIQIAHGDNEGIIILVTPEAMELRLPTFEWPHPHSPGPSSRLWKRIKWESLGNKRLLRLVEEAKQARLGEFATCRFCKKRFPPECMHDDDVCHGCSERHLGVCH
jgi:hypothetical protein